MMERFTYDKGKYYDKGVEITNDDICNLLNDYSDEDKRLNDVIIGLHDDLRNQSHKIRQLEQLIMQLNWIIDSYQIIYQTLRE